MTSDDEVLRLVSASCEMAAGAEQIFELIADPTQQPRWDGNDNLAEAPPGQRIRAVGEVFAMTTTKGNVRANHVVEFDEGRRIAWRPAEPGQEPPGHLWRWELEPDRLVAHACHPHLRLDATDGRDALPTCSGDHGRQTSDLAGPTRRPRRAWLSQIPSTPRGTMR